jgi:hypothetical protein
MSITQTVEVPASRRLTIDVPPQTPIGAQVIIQFPVSDEAEAASSDNNDKIRMDKIAALKRITGILSENTMTLDDARKERLSRQ